MAFKAAAIDAGMVHHREHVADALVFFADQVANSAFVVAVGHDGGRTAVNAQLVFDGRADQVVALAQRAVFVNQEFRHQEE